MTEADKIFSAHGVASVDVVKSQIAKALAVSDEAEALRLDSLLQDIEGLVQGCRATYAGQACGPEAGLPAS